jgi:hypothetical protein
VLAPRFERPLAFARFGRGLLGGRFGDVLSVLSIRFAAVAISPPAAGLSHLGYRLGSHRPRELLDRRSALKVHADIGHRGGASPRARALIDRRVLGLTTHGLAVRVARLVRGTRGAVSEHALLLRIHTHFAYLLARSLHAKCLRRVASPAQRRSVRG